MRVSTLLSFGLLALACFAVSASASSLLERRTGVAVKALQPAGAAPSAAAPPAGGNSAQIAALQAQIAALKAADKLKQTSAKKTSAKANGVNTNAKHYDVREAQVNPDGSHSTSGRFAKRPPPMSAWSAAIVAARNGDLAALAKAPQGPFTEPSRSYWGQSGNVRGGPAGWCGVLTNGWQTPGNCSAGETCMVASVRPDFARRYYCISQTSSSFRARDAAGGEKDVLPPNDLPTTAPPKPPAPRPADRCGGCPPGQFCRVTAMTSDYWQCMD